MEGGVLVENCGKSEGTNGSLSFFVEYNRRLHNV
jgi:hypothetical protein